MIRLRILKVSRIQQNNNGITLIGSSHHRINIVVELTNQSNSVSIPFRYFFLNQYAL